MQGEDGLFSRFRRVFLDEHRSTAEKQPRVCGKMGWGLDSLVSDTAYECLMKDSGVSDVISSKWTTINLTVAGCEDVEGVKVYQPALSSGM